jgi:polysaccharide biosynthesis protein PslG
MKCHRFSRVSAWLLIAMSGIALFAVQPARAKKAQQVVTSIASNESSAKIGVQVKIETFTADDARAISRAGFAFVRFGVWTNNLSNEAYQRRIQSAFAFAKNAKLPVLLTMRSTEVLVLTGGPKASSLDAAGRLFGRSVRKTVESYAPQIIGVELWNEPELSRYWPTGNVTTTFPAFMHGACAELTDSPLPVPVYGFGFARAPIDNSVSARLLRTAIATSPRCINVVSYHAYGMTPAAMQNAATEIRSSFGLPTAITEWGVPTRGSLTTSPAAQARKFADFLASADMLKTSLVSIYEWKETSAANSERERSFGLIETSGKPKPALDSVLSYFGSHAASR